MGEELRYKSINKINYLLFTNINYWIDERSSYFIFEQPCYKKTHIYFRPVKLYHNGKEIKSENLDF